MNCVRRTVIRSFAGVAIALRLAAAPASAAASTLPEPAAGCVLEPGVYGITDSSGRLVGLLIVYPDCRVEVFKRPEIT